MVIVGADVVSFGAPTLQFGMIVASTLVSVGSIERPRGIAEHKKGDLGVQAWISVDFTWISGPRFESVWQILEH